MTLQTTSSSRKALATSPPSPGKPRLRIPGDPRNPTVASLQRSAPQFGTGCFWVIRNPATHEIADWPPQEALEQLTALSVLARLIDMCEVARTDTGRHVPGLCAADRDANGPAPGACSSAPPRTGTGVPITE